MYCELACLSFAVNGIFVSLCVTVNSSETHRIIVSLAVLCVAYINSKLAGASGWQLQLRWRLGMEGGDAVEGGGGMHTHKKGMQFRYSTVAVVWFYILLYSILYVLLGFDGLVWAFENIAFLRNAWHVERFCSMFVWCLRYDETWFPTAQSTVVLYCTVTYSTV